MNDEPAGTAYRLEAGSFASFKRKGWLVKEGTFMHKRRWFVLSPDDGMLFFGKSPTAERALGALRLTVGRPTTPEEVDQAVVEIVDAVKALKD